MKKQIAVLCFILLAGFACKKPLKDYTISGTVTDDQTGNPIANARIELRISFGTAMVGSSIYDGEGYATTDANGHYDMILKDADRNREKGKLYHISVFSNEIEVYEYDTLVLPEYPGDRHRQLDFHVPVSGYYAISLHNANPFDQSDEINLFYFDPESGYIPGGNTPYVGTNVNQTLTGRKKHGRSVLHYTVKRNNVYTEFTDTLIIPRTPDTLFYQLNY